MDTNKLIEQTAQAAERYIAGWLKLDENLLHDLKILAADENIETWEPGELGIDIINASIKKFGADISDDVNFDVFRGNLISGNLEILKLFLGDFDEGHLLLLDQILWSAMTDFERKAGKIFAGESIE